MSRSESIGSILLRHRVVNDDQLETALAEQSRSGGRVGEILVQMGYASESELTWALAHQLNIPYIPRLETQVDNLDREAIARLSGEMAHRLGVFPIMLDREAITIAMTDPLNQLAVKAIERATGVRVRVAMSEGAEVRRALKLAYPDGGGGPAAPLMAVSGWGLLPEGRAEILADVSGATLLRWLISQASTWRSTALRFVPQGNGGLVYADGVVFDSSPGPFKLAGEWYEQVLACLDSMDEEGPRPRKLQTGTGMTARLSLLGWGVQGGSVPKKVLAALNRFEQPGVLLVCCADEGIRDQVMIRLATALVDDSAEILAQLGAAAPAGAIRLSGASVVDAMRFGGRVLSLDVSDIAVVSTGLVMGRPKGWVLLPVATGDLVEAAAVLRDVGVPAGVVTQAVVGALEVFQPRFVAGGEGSITDFRLVPINQEADEAFLSWDMRALKAWRERALRGDRCVAVRVGAAPARSGVGAG